MSCDAERINIGDNTSRKERGHRRTRCRSCRTKQRQTPPHHEPRPTTRLLIVVRVEQPLKMAMSYQQAQAEGLVLRHPENLGLHREVTLDMAVQMLLRAPGMSQNVPYSWTYIDRPMGKFKLDCGHIGFTNFSLEGQLYMICMAQNLPFPADGIRWQEQETRFTLPADNSNQRVCNLHLEEKIRSF